MKKKKIKIGKPNKLSNQNSNEKKVYNYKYLPKDFSGDLYRLKLEMRDFLLKNMKKRKKYEKKEKI